jgi:hypothetical protein
MEGNSRHPTSFTGRARNDDPGRQPYAISGVQAEEQPGPLKNYDMTLNQLKGLLTERKWPSNNKARPQRIL